MSAFRMTTAWGRRRGWEIQKLMLGKRPFYRLTGRTWCLPADDFAVALWRASGMAFGVNGPTTLRREAPSKPCSTSGCERSQKGDREERFTPGDDVAAILGYLWLADWHDPCNGRGHGTPHRLWS